MFFHPILALVACAPSFQDAPAKSETPPPRPRIGLVLSGGSAHTLAQVGALEALEELHVPVDFVVGSGSGALIGGLYAAGFTPREVHDQLQDRLWLDALSGKVPRPLLSWRQRTVDRDFLFDLPVSFGPGHFGLARGLARTRWISWLLSSATIRTSGTTHFDDLPVPFRAIATDLLRGERVVLDSGDLPTAILASMVMPGLYAPVEIGGRQLASGALLDPIPVDAAFAAGCDTLIVIDCSLELDNEERLESFMSLMGHVRVLAGDSGRRAALAQLRPHDIRVEPDARGADEEDYRGGDGVIEAGRVAVMTRSAEFTALALDDADWARHLAARLERRPALPVVDDVRIEDSTGLDAAVLRDRVECDEGRTMEEDEVATDLRRLYGLDYHERIDAVLEPRGDGHADLVLRTHEAEEFLWNPRAGAALEGVFGEDATFTIGAAFTMRPIGGRGAEWRNRVEVGSRIFVLSEYWQPIDSSARWFLAPAVGYRQERTNVTEGEDVVATLDVYAFGGKIDVGRVLGEWGEARIGLVKQAGEVSRAIGTPGSDDSVSFNQGFLEGSLTIDTVDSLSLPREGTIGRVEVTTPVSWLGGEQEHYVQAQIDHAMSWDRTSIVFGAEFDSALDDEEALQNAFPLGGFLRLSGLGRDSITGAHVGLARAVTRVELGRRGLDRRFLNWNLGCSIEAGQAWAERDDIDFDSLRMSGSLFVAAETLFGTVFLGGGVTEPGETAIFLVFGNLFGDWEAF